jgi:hypothetical protein
VRAIALVLALLVSTPAATRPSTLPPIDQCSKDADFAAFLGELKRVTVARDRNAFLALLSDDVTVDFGGGSGRDAFAKSWSFDPGEHGNIWEWLDRMLGMGCARVDGARVIPSLIEQVDTEDGNAFDMRLVLPGAKLFREPANEGTASDVPAWTVVDAINTGGDMWTGVRLADGRKGWISDDDLYEPLGYRMTIEKRGSKWMITAFVAGD